MKDYKLSELKEICKNNNRCYLCPVYSMCNKFRNGYVKFSDLSINNEEDDE